MADVGEWEFIRSRRVAQSAWRARAGVVNPPFTCPVTGCCALSHRNTGQAGAFALWWGIPACRQATPETP